MQGNRLRSSLGHALVVAFRLVNRVSNRAFLPMDLSAEQAHLLLVLWNEGPMKVGELQRILALGSGTLTGALDRMDKAGLVRRVPDASDRRAFRVEPAPCDARRQKKLEKTATDLEDEAFAALTTSERKELLRLLLKLADASS
jgi:DNA-binding MarR family transcriptional regulator